MRQISRFHKNRLGMVAMGGWGIALAFSPALGQNNALQRMKNAVKSGVATVATVPIFRGGGSAQLPREPVDVGSAPAAMSAASQQSLASQLSAAGMGTVVVQPSNRYVRLTPSKPFTADKGALIFSGAIVNCAEDYAFWGYVPEPASVKVRLYSPANRKYLLDFAVSSEAQTGNNTRAFKLEGAGTSEIFRDQGGAQHLTAALDVTTAGWQTYTLKITGGAFTWSFFSVEVTKI